ncbi:cobalamin (vitamin B12) biosynthesis CbiX protein [Rippkaea orientalis PCC 8801]|uniref:Cobalamin (Vitamin B12) biosynthesis CbiX protein n=2 Tax=Rippkaea TaxID=2546365 RepID=B7K1B1_RIPO1|nr:cobalamin (vitamin B12) biosynthesis CbiX protein [Rippkaea orientalis PCC 8801]
MTSAYLLVTHGSRDRRPQIALENLAILVKQRLSVRTPIIIETASLELTPIPLAQKIEQLALKSKNLTIIPLFLLPGVHVREDIPKEIAIAQQNTGGGVTIKLAPYLGSYSRLPHLIARQFGEDLANGKILIGHGSRYPQGNQPLQDLATHLNALDAYWSVKPSLNDQFSTLIDQGKETITIVPYFLFAGGITQAIAQQVQQLQSTWPQVHLQYGQPLGATPELAQLIVEEIEND